MYCKKCGAYLPDDALVCTACGAPVSAPAARPGEGAAVPPP
ncbi:zinc-ribbon domain-containing protein, partial [Allofournierella sp.]